MTFSPANIAAFIVATAFSAGLNLYATLVVLGLLAHTQWVALPQGLELLVHWWVIGVSGALFLAEFIADKIPALDILWNALHTFVRIPAAALLSYRAADHLSPGLQIAAVTAGALVAAISHSSKTAVRVAVTPSPEPASNIALSSVEDAGAIGLTWLATVHPFVAAGLAVALLVAAVVAVRWVVLRLQAVIAKVQNYFGANKAVEIVRAK